MVDRRGGRHWGRVSVLFGFGRFIHDTLPIAALCTFMVWMIVSSDG